MPSAHPTAPQQPAVTAASAGPAPVPPRRATFLPFGALWSGRASWLGLAAFFTWVDLMFCFEGVLRDTVLEAGGLVHDPAFAGATLAAGIALVALAALAGRLGGRLERALFGRRAVGIAFVAVGAGASGCLAVLAGALPSMPAVATGALGCAMGLGMAWLMLAWGVCLARRDLRETLLHASAAACAQWLPFAVLNPLVDALGFPAGAVLVVTLPAASYLLLRRAVRGDAGADADGDTLPGGPSRLRARPGSPAVLVRMAVMVGVFSCVIQFIWSCFIKLLPGRLDVGLFPAVFAILAAVSLVCVLGCALVMERQVSYRLELYYRATFLLCLCGVAATGLAAQNASTAQLMGSYATVYAGYSLVAPTMWMLSLGFVHMRRARPLGVLPAVFAGQFLGLFCGFAAVDLAMEPLFADAGPQVMPAVVLACVAVLAAAYVGVFPERDLLSLSPLLFGMSHERLGLRCEAVARRCGLTPREAEVLALLARGRDVAFVCDELCISRNTVNAHRKSIYAKLGVHSQQELLTAVEDAGA